VSVILYEHINFRGKHKHIIGRNEPNLHRDDWGDRVSSIQILAGQWQFFEHKNYRGNRITLGPGNYRRADIVDFFGIYNDTLSSVRRLSPKVGLVGLTGLIIYQHINYKGDHKHIIDRDEVNLHVDGWGDKISSFQIITGRWEFCQHVNYKGWRTICGPGNYRWVKEVGISNDSISSIRRHQPLLAVNPMPTIETILYQHIDYRGDHKHLINHGQRNLHSDGWGDRVSSFQVISGRRWTFHEHKNYDGVSISPNPGSYRWIEDMGMKNDRLSSVRANIIPVFFKTIQGAAPNINRDFRVANEVFNPHDIEFFNLGQDTNNAPVLLDLDQPSCFRGQNPTDEEDALYNLERDHAPSDIVVYYLRSTNLGVFGCAAHPANRPGSVVTDTATQYTMGHEIGHVLGLSHVTDTTNLMHGGGTTNITLHPPNLTNAQITTIRGSKYLV
jgi:hypothetical protein